MALSSKQKRFIKNNRRKLSVAEMSKRTEADLREVKEYIKLLPVEVDPGRKRIYRIILILFPILFILLLELGLRLFQYGGNLDLFIDAPGGYSEYKMCNPYVGKRYFVMQSTVPNPSNDIFLKKKPENGYRIFVLGGSTTAGYPYGENIMFSRILHKRLEDAFPNKHIEVVNTATAAINSYTLYDFTDEILQNQPDAVLIYAGHNEFYGALGVASTESFGKYPAVIKAYLSLKHFRTFLLLRDVIVQFQRGVHNIFSSGTVADPTATLMERLVGEQTIPYKSTIYEMGKKQFRENLSDILGKFQRANIPVLVGELVSNIRDQKPFISVKTPDYPTAENVYKKAKLLESQQQFQQAREYYYQAKDLDALRFRATEEFNQIIHQVANKFDATLVPLKSYFESASTHGLIGNNLTLEHLHPNIDGYFLMADAFFETMRRNHFISPNWHKRRLKSSEEFKSNWGMTALDSAYADLRVQVLKGGWPFKSKSVPNRALANYRPTTKAESLVVKTWVKENKTLERAHVELAEYYKKLNMYLKTFKEYRALMHLTPYNVSPYLKAADALIKLGRLEQALPILYQSLDLERTYFANKWIGQILLKKNETKTSLQYLEKAYQIKKKDPQLLYNLSGAYALNAQYTKSEEYLSKLEKINPNFPDADHLRRQLNKILEN